MIEPHRKNAGLGPRKKFCGSTHQRQGRWDRWDRWDWCPGHWSSRWSRPGGLGTKHWAPSRAVGQGQTSTHSFLVGLCWSTGVLSPSEIQEESIDKSVEIDWNWLKSPPSRPTWLRMSWRCHGWYGCCAAMRCLFDAQSLFQGWTVAQMPTPKWVNNTTSLKRSFNNVCNVCIQHPIWDLSSSYVILRIFTSLFTVPARRSSTRRGWSWRLPTRIVAPPAFFKGWDGWDFNHPPKGSGFNVVYGVGWIP